MYRAESVSVAAGGRLLVEDASLAVQPGRVTVLVGPNGAGKSTLLKAMSGEHRLSGGRLTLDGVVISRLSPLVLARRRAVLPQAAEVAFPFTAGEVIAAGLMAPDGRDGARIARLLAQVDLPGFAQRRYDSLSGGERQRVQLARILAQLELTRADAPSYLFLDEPTASLDLAHQLTVLRLARAHADKGGGVLAVLHDLNLAAMVADEIVVLAQGRIRAAGPAGEVISEEVLEAAFGVRVRVGIAPPGPFVLPQNVQGAG
ncbi:heme ABC transporter ATP-binding protein [Xanthobacter autotrophicus]|uniref:heme ABC transporter ATP-binding protein n=1 Tax=Xanthobacter autotrophicus TaxID=280 RepID=UPI0024A73702|nr:heme ABC transporter ATP-binding protein [Xanthobacter autotrophicus]MDI4658035.1 heme ABC transporter ATP-binding protein [Xanthobacter autotrophicus]